MAAVYAVVAWILIQLVGNLTPMLRLRKQRAEKCSCIFGMSAIHGAAANRSCICCMPAIPGGQKNARH